MIDTITVMNGSLKTLLISLLWCLFLFFNKFMTYDVCSCLLLKYFRSQLWNDWRLILSKRICMVSDTFSNFQCTHVKFCWYFPDWIQFGLYTIFVIYLNVFFFTMIGFSLEYRPTFSIYTAHTVRTMKSHHTQPILTGNMERLSKERKINDVSKYTCAGLNIASLQLSS